MYKEHFSVGEIAKLFKMTTQTLRFYDKMGIFKPSYINPKNSYRYYTLSQFEILTMINYLRSLDMPLEDIKAYFDEKSEKSLVEILERELKKTNEKIQSFNSVKLRLQEEILITKNRDRFDNIDVHYFKKRMVAFHLLNSANLQETHHAFGILSSRYAHLKDMRFGTIIGENSMKRGKYQFHSTFLFIEKDSDMDGLPYFLQEGEYLCSVSTGGHVEQEKTFCKLINHINEKNLEINGDGILLLLSHNHSKNSKILFELQIPIKSKINSTI